MWTKLKQRIKILKGRYTTKPNRCQKLNKDKELLTVTVLVNKEFLTGTVPVNNSAH